MMQSAADGKRDQLEWPFNHNRLLGSTGGVAIQSLMGPGSMVVLRNVFAEQSVQVPFTEHDDVIEQFSAERSEKPFYIRILKSNQMHPVRLLSRRFGSLILSILCVARRFPL